jgi:hypothetical protein
MDSGKIVTSDGDGWRRCGGIYAGSEGANDDFIATEGDNDNDDGDNDGDFVATAGGNDDDDGDNDGGIVTDWVVTNWRAWEGYMPGVS